MESDDTNRSESPDIIYGRLLESAHLFGYAWERATDSFEWLLDDDRWKQVGGGFDDINDFLKSIAKQSSQFKYLPEQRKRVAQKLAELQASQRTAAEALGVSHQTVGRDIGPSGPADIEDEASDQDQRDNNGSNGPPDHLRQDPGDVHKKAQQKAHTSRNSGENEWYTPPEIIQATIEVMGAIDLDPASSAAANAQIQAASYFDKDNDGLSQQWHGRVWLNPPYSSDLVRRFAEKLCDEYIADHVTEACLLSNNATETKWFQRTAVVANRVCFPEGRLSYWHPDRTSKTPLQGQAVLYFGGNPSQFESVFQRFGVVLKT